MIYNSNDTQWKYKYKNRWSLRLFNNKHKELYPLRTLPTSHFSTLFRCRTTRSDHEGFTVIADTHEGVYNSQTSEFHLQKGQHSIKCQIKKKYQVINPVTDKPALSLRSTTSCQRKETQSRDIRG